MCFRFFFRRRMADPKSLVDGNGIHYVLAAEHIAEMQKMKEQNAKLQAQTDAVKELAREAERKAEVAKHKSPQIKRSVKFLMSADYDVQDLKELLGEASKAPPAEVYDFLARISEKVDSLGSKVDEECLANKIASKAKYGWRTVKHFETNSLFTGDDAEAMTKKLRSAEYQAGKDAFRGKARGFFRKNRTRWDHSYSDERLPAKQATSTSTTTSEKLCHHCGEAGHFVRFCPNKK